ncbi:serine/threonine-protein kinase [Hamadaea tsunoensis]|uniref:serine/threonine-protein kinase n=1 Tax=Hamadaea tsunoensis TaxID=53368 RepID=UPI000482923D|nr:serine/threonine-protein kinase [Hamadaea tsunoensis]
MTDMVGRYRLLEPLAIGGTAGVWRGWDELLGRTVAVKVLDRALLADPVGRERLRQEAVILARLNHPRIAALYDYGTDRRPHRTGSSEGPGAWSGTGPGEWSSEGHGTGSGEGAGAESGTAAGEAGDEVPYLVLELIDGVSLGDLLHGGGRLPWPAAVRLAGQVAEALDAAHEQGLVHRDIAPGNVLLSADGVKVVDFGIGAATGAPETYFGTPGYVAPERLAGAPAGPAADVYALGVLLHQALFGCLPGGPVPIVEGLPAEVTVLLERCLAEAPQRRPTAAEVAAVAAVVAAGTPAVTDLPGVTRMLLAGPAPKRRLSGRGRILGIAALVALIGAWSFVIVHGAAPTAATGGTPPAAACHVAYQVTKDDGRAFAASVTVTNTGAQPLAGWRVAFGLPGGQRVDPAVGAQWTEQDTTVTSRPQPAGLDPAKAAQLDFAGAYAGSNPLPTRFTVNDQPCTATVLGVPGTRPIAGAPVQASTHAPVTTGPGNGGPGGGPGDGGPGGGSGDHGKHKGRDAAEE